MPDDSLARLREYQLARHEALVRGRALSIERQNQIRAMTAELKAKTLDPWALLRGEVVRHEPHFSRLRIPVALRMIPGIGRVRMMEVMMAMRVSPELRIEALSPERRLELARLAEAATHFRYEDYVPDP